MTPPGTLTVHAEIEQRTEEWYAQRCGLITASAIGKLITARHKGAAEYDCPECLAQAGQACRSKTRPLEEIKTLHAERTAHATANRSDDTRILEPADTDDARGLVSIAAAERITGFVDPTFQSIDMCRGVEDEPFAVAAYTEHHAPVEPCGFMARSWDGCTLGYSPDGLVGTHGLIEVKSRRGKTQVDTILAGQVPAENYAQLQAGLFVSGREWIDYISYAAGMHLWTKRVTPDPAWFVLIQAAVEVFEDHVTATVNAYNDAVKGLPAMPRPILDMVL